MENMDDVVYFFVSSNAQSYLLSFWPLETLIARQHAHDAQTRQHLRDGELINAAIFRHNLRAFNELVTAPAITFSSCVNS